MSADIDRLISFKDTGGLEYRAVYIANLFYAVGEILGSITAGLIGDSYG